MRNGFCSREFSRLYCSIYGVMALVFLAAMPDKARAYNTPGVNEHYNVSPGELNGPPGSIIRVWPPHGGGPAGVRAFRILYRSRDAHGKPIAVSGVVYFPEGKAPPEGRRIVAWAHPTTGVASRCAPSLAEDLQAQIMGFDELVRQKYVIVATDYPGLGTPGIHPYLIGKSEGRALLDSVRAARALPGTGAGKEYALWGHSQGGHAVLFGADEAASYAPELKLVGAAAAAPATNLIELFKADMPDAGGKVLVAYALWSWAKIYNQPLDSAIDPSKRPAVEKTATDCMMSLTQFLSIDRAEKPLLAGFLTINAVKTEPWAGIMRRNSPRPTPANVPLFLAQGTADTTVRPPITRAYAKSVCAQGGPVHFVWLEGTGHVFAAKKSARRAVRWIDERFRGEAPPNDCGNF